MNVFRKLFLKDNRVRRDSRVRADTIVDCLIYSIKRNETHSVFRNDISHQGMSFLMKNSAFEIGDEIEIHLQNRNKDKETVLGQLVSQKIYYFTEADDLKNAIFRFSAIFQTPIEDDVLDKFKHH